MVRGLSNARIIEHLTRQVPRQMVLFQQFLHEPGRFILQVQYCLRLALPNRVQKDSLIRKKVFTSPEQMHSRREDIHLMKYPPSANTFCSNQAIQLILPTFVPLQLPFSLHRLEHYFQRSTPRNLGKLLSLTCPALSNLPPPFCLLHLPVLRSSGLHNAVTVVFFASVACLWGVPRSFCFKSAKIFDNKFVAVIF